MYPSSHISLSPNDRDRNPDVTLLTPEDLEELCKVDEASLKSAMAKPTAPDVSVRVAIIPDATTMQWHHAREELLCMRLYSRYPSSKGALAQTADGRRAWCVWTRRFGATPDDYVLYIIRLVVEGEDVVGRLSGEALGDEDQGPVEQAIAAILGQAQLEAARWGMAKVEFWNPSPLTVAAAKRLQPSVQVVERDDESLTSLRWHGEALPAGSKIEWIANEKYAWC